MRKPHLTLIFDINIQERYEETSGNILLTLRSITQKPLQYFLDNKDFTKVRNIFPRNLREQIAIAQVDETFGVEFSSAEEKVHFSDYKNLSNLEGHRY